MNEEQYTVTYDVYLGDDDAPVAENVTADFGPYVVGKELAEKLDGYIGGVKIRSKYPDGFENDVDHGLCELHKSGDDGIMVGVVTTEYLAKLQTEASVQYLALMGGFYLPNAFGYEDMDRSFKYGVWTEAMLRDAVSAKRITREEFTEITGKDY